MAVNKNTGSAPHSGSPANAAEGDMLALMAAPSIVPEVDARELPKSNLKFLPEGTLFEVHGSFQSVRPQQKRRPKKLQ